MPDWAPPPSQTPPMSSPNKPTNQGRPVLRPQPWLPPAGRRANGGGAAYLLATNVAQGCVLHLCLQLFIAALLMLTGPCLRWPIVPSGLLMSLKLTLIPIY